MKLLVINFLFIISFGFFPSTGHSQFWNYTSEKADIHFTSLAVDYDSGFVALVYYVDINQPWIFKFDQNGKLIQKIFIKNNIYATSILTTNEGYLLSGMSYELEAAGDPFLLTLDFCFKPLKYTIYSALEENTCDLIALDKNRQIVLFKYLNRDYFTFTKLKADGTIAKAKTYNLAHGNVTINGRAMLFWGGTYRPMSHDTNVASLKACLVEMDTNLTNIRESVIYSGQDAYLGYGVGYLYKINSGGYIGGYVDRRDLNTSTAFANAMKLNSIGNPVKDVTFSNPKLEILGFGFQKISSNSFTLISGPGNLLPKDNGVIEFTIIDSNVVKKFTKKDTFNFSFIGIDKIIMMYDSTIVIAGTGAYANGLSSIFMRRYNLNWDRITTIYSHKNYGYQCANSIKFIDSITLTLTNTIDLKDSMFPLSTIPMSAKTNNCIDWIYNHERKEIDISNNCPNGRVSFQIFSTGGQKIKEGTINTDPIISLKNLEPGIYYISIFSTQNHFRMSKAICVYE